MHKVVLDVVAIWLLVVVSAEPGQSLVTEVRLHRVHTSYQDVESAVELLFVQNQRIVNVSLDQVFVVESRLGQVGELFEQDDAIASSAFARLGDERLARELPQVMLEVSHLVWE